MFLALLDLHVVVKLGKLPHLFLVGICSGLHTPLFVNLNPLEALKDCLLALGKTIVGKNLVDAALELIDFSFLRAFELLLDRNAQR